MGRTVPTFVQRVEETSQHWAKYRRALRREDQEYFDRLFQRVRSYTPAATYQCHDNTMEAILLSIALDMEKRLCAVERILQHARVRHEIAGMDSGPVSQPARDDSLADRRKPKTLPFD
jgi:hypothetical protein